MEKTIPIEREGSIGVKARTVLWYLTFFGFAINYIIRINASIAIVDMIDVNFKKSSSNKTIVTSECIAEANLTISPELSNEINLDDNSKYISLERRLLDSLKVSHEHNAHAYKVNLAHESHRLNTSATVSNGTNISSRSCLDRSSGCIGFRSCPAEF